MRLVLAQVIRLAALGMAIGLAGALGLTRMLRGLLFGVTPTDPTTFAGVAVLLGAVALLAGYVPARRATKVDPISTLRLEYRWFQPARFRSNNYSCRARSIVWWGGK